MIYLLTAIGLSPGGSTHLHTNNTSNNTNNNRTTQTTNVEEWGRAPSLRVFPGIFIKRLIKTKDLVMRVCFNKDKGKILHIQGHKTQKGNRSIIFL